VNNLMAEEIVRKMQRRNQRIINNRERKEYKKIRVRRINILDYQYDKLAQETHQLRLLLLE
jgi:hypothetical protein